MQSISADIIRQRLSQIASELLRLEGERDGLRKLLDASENGSKQRAAPGSSGRSLFASNPETRGATERIKALLAQSPGLTKKDITNRLAGDDRELRKVIYNTAHSLARRQKLLMDDDGRLSLPK